MFNFKLCGNYVVLLRCTRTTISFLVQILSLFNSLKPDYCLELSFKSGKSKIVLSSNLMKVNTLTLLFGILSDYTRFSLDFLD
jgi:hypothetical protein